MSRDASWHVVREARVQRGRIQGKLPLRSINFLHTSSLSYHVPHRVLAQSNKDGCVAAFRASGQTLEAVQKANPAVVAPTHPAHSFFPFDSDPVTPVTEEKCRPD
jgi:hypothetical protein